MSIYADVDKIALKYISKGFSSVDAYELAYTECEKGLKQ